MHLLCLIQNKNHQCLSNCQTVVYTSDGKIFIFYQFFSLFIPSLEEMIKLSTKTQKSSQKTHSPMCTKNYWLTDVWLGSFNHLVHFSFFSHQRQKLLIEFFAALKRIWFWIRSPRQKLFDKDKCFCCCTLFTEFGKVIVYR